MKRLVFLGLVAIVFAACAGLPKPESESDSLVIGSFVLDFPDGFFDRPRQKFDTNISLAFSNQTRNTKFSLKTMRGFFHFLSNGSDEYVLQSYKFTIQNDGKYTIGERPIGLTITTTPGRVIYLGHITITYKKTALAERTGPGRQEASIWDYDVSADRRWDQDDLIQYLTKQDPDYPWLDCEIVEYSK